MKFTSNSNELLKQIQSISGILNSNNALPILDNFLFEIKKENLTISASDLASSMSVVIDKNYTCNEEGNIAIPAKLLLDILKTFSNQILTFIINNDNFSIEISSENGNYNLESILPGYYGSRPRHIHIKITTPNEEILVSQLYFGNDPYCENDEWCQDAEDRIILLEENELGLYGGMDLIMNSSDNGIVLGDINFDNLINIQDIVLLVGIILNDFNPIDFQIYSGNVNNDDAIDVLDIIQIINIILSD